MRIKIVVSILLVFVLAAGIGLYAFQKDAHGEETPRAAAIAYLESLKKDLEGAKAIPLDVDPATGRVIGIHADSPYRIDRMIAYCANAAEVRQVEDIPELAHPLVYAGDKMTGNNETLYFSEGDTIYAFSLSEADRLAFLLYLTESGSLYPAVQDAFTEGVIRQLQNELHFGDKDILTFSNGHLESIDIKTPETAAVLFQCIRNCVQISDLTDADLEPMALPLEINGQGTGTFDMIFTTYQETGQLICISFSAADAGHFYDYVMALQSEAGAVHPTAD